MHSILKMKKITTLLCQSFLLTSCYQGKLLEDFKFDKWEQRKVDLKDLSFLNTGLTYLPVYSQRYYVKDVKQVVHSSTGSFRNMQVSDIVYMLKVDCFNGVGNKIKSFTDSPNYLKPKESIEVLIANNANYGSIGAKSNFDGARPNLKNRMLFEAIMISTKGQQGLPFSTRKIEQNY